MTRWAGVVLGLSFTIAATAAEDPAPSSGPKIAALARLVLKPGSEESQALLRSGLLDERPSVRSAAARIAHVMPEGALLPDLRVALAKEADAEAALEESWALADLDETGESDSVLVEAVSNPMFGRNALTGFVAGRGPKVSSSWAKLKGRIEEEPGALAVGLERGLHESSSSMFASYALRDRMPGLFEVLVLSDSVHLESPVMMVALTSSSTQIRSLAYLYLADLGVALKASEIPQRLPPDSLDERLSAHLFEAAQGLNRSEKLTDLIVELSADPGTATRLRTRLARKGDAPRGLSKDERESLYRAAGFDKEEIERVAKRTFQDSPPVPAPPSAPRALVIKTPSGHPPDLVRSVFEATGCKGSERSFDGAEVTYQSGGRAAHVATLRSNTSAPGCGEAAQILGATALASDGDRHVLSILPERPEFLACMAETVTVAPGLPTSEKGARVGGRITEPRKTRNVAPRYPEAAKANRVQGIVLLEATIRESGCVAGLTVLKGVERSLDLEGIDAVSGWKYTPTLLNGIPVPVIMTVTINFRLN